MRKTTILIFTLLLTVFCVPVHAASGNENPVYLIVLTSAKPNEAFDVAEFGGTQLARSGRRLAISIPEAAVDGLRRDPRVRSIQRAVVGEHSPTATAGREFSMRASADAVRTPVVNSGPVWTTGTYKYDGSGNIWSIGSQNGITDSTSQGVDRFTYDGAARLTSATVYAGTAGHTESFGYDPYGNLTSKVTDGSSISFAVNAATNRYQAPMSVTYDPLGNVDIDSFGNHHDYDAAGMVKAKGSETYVYTADDERIAVSLGTVITAGWRWTLREPDQRVVREFESFGGMAGSDYFLWIEDHFYAGTQLVAAEREATEGGRRHFHADHLGTARFMTNESAQILSEHTYRPFGVEITSAAQERARGYDRDEPTRFTGHERDGINDVADPTFGYMDYMHARYYNPFWGRFLSVDPVLDLDKTIHNPQMWNRYAYVTNNPLRYTDPTGKNLWETLFRVVRYIGKEEKVVARVKAISKSKAMEGIERGIKVAREEKATTSIAVVTESKQARDAVGKQLSQSGKIRPPERSGIWPEHVNPADGPNADIHVQTVDATKSAGFGKALGAGLLAIIGANTMAANANPDATPGEVASAFLWDSAKAIDPIFLTDVIEHATGADAYAEENPPE